MNNRQPDIITMGRDSYGSVSTPAWRECNELFSSVVKGVNGMTPYRYGYVKTPNGVIEISEGTPLDAYLGFKMWGVTVVENGVKNSDKCQGFFSLTEAIDYIKQITNEYPTNNRAPLIP